MLTNTVLVQISCDAAAPPATDAALLNLLQLTTLESDAKLQIKGRLMNRIQCIMWASFDITTSPKCLSSNVYKIKSLQ